MSQRSRTQIDPVQSAPDGGGASSSDSGWVTVFKAFNPLGPVVDAYAKTLAYRIESKRLVLEDKRVEEQSRTVNNVINKTYEMKMEELRHRRIALERTFDLAEQNLTQLHVERMQVLEMARIAQANMTKDGLSLDERAMFKDMAVELTRQLPAFGQSAQQSLQSLVQALPPIEMPRALLEGD